MRTVALKLDNKQMLELRAELGHIKDGVNKAVINAVNKSAQKANTQVVRALDKVLTSDRKALVGSKFRPRVHVEGFNWKGQVGNAAYIVVGGRMALRHFKSKQSASGRNIQIMTTGSPVNVTGAFGGRFGNRWTVLVKDKSQSKYRQTKAHYKKNIGKLRYHVKTVGAVELADIVDQMPELDELVRVTVVTEFPIQLDSQVNRLLGRKKSDQQAKAA